MTAKTPNLKRFTHRDGMDAFRIFLIIEFWLLLAGVGLAFVNLWLGLGLIALVLVLLVAALLVGGF